MTAFALKNAAGQSIRLTAIGQSIRSNVCAVKFYYQIEGMGMDDTMPSWTVPCSSWEQMQATVRAFTETQPGGRDHG